jgi:hypothetical protein
MIKLYRKDGGRLFYHEAWESDGVVTEHWGECPDSGESREHAVARGIEGGALIEKILQEPRSRGYEEIDMDDHARLMIEFRIEGMGTPSDLKKRHALEDRMSEALGWAGIGMCDGGSIGSGTMEVCCLVADYLIAERFVREELTGTKFADFHRIYREE